MKVARLGQDVITHGGQIMYIYIHRCFRAREEVLKVHLELDNTISANSKC